MGVSAAGRRSAGETGLIPTMEVQIGGDSVGAGERAARLPRPAMDGSSACHMFSLLGFSPTSRRQRRLELRSGALPRSFAGSG